MKQFTLRQFRTLMGDLNFRITSIEFIFEALKNNKQKYDQFIGPFLSNHSPDSKKLYRRPIYFSCKAC